MWTWYAVALVVAVAVGTLADLLLPDFGGKGWVVTGGAIVAAFLVAELVALRRGRPSVFGRRPGDPRA